MNDTYLTAWNRIPPTRPRYFAAFLCRIVRNLSLKRFEYINAEKRAPNARVSLSELEEILPDNRIRDGVEDEALSELFTAFLRGEREITRCVFLRRYWFFESVAEIARRYSFSENKVKSMLFRTRNKLRAYLEKEGVEI